MNDHIEQSEPDAGTETSAAPQNPAVDHPAEPSGAAAAVGAPTGTTSDLTAESGPEVVDPADAPGGDETAAPDAASNDAGTGGDAETGGDDEDEHPLETEAEIAADYLEELLDIADLDGDIDTFIEGDRAHVSIVSESDVLVGPGGQVLDALQELTRLAVMTETGDRSRLMLDVAGYRDRRRKELVALATDAINEVKGSNEKLPLSPMNPFERKIVHDVVAAAGLKSASEGEEPRRRVVVLPA